MADKLGIYIHIPFCRSKCDYCDFYSLAGQEGRMDDYQKALITHMKETAPQTRGYQIDTVYFGGGTPSYYGEKRLRELLRLIAKRFDLAKDAEITVECNPDSVDLKMLQSLRRLAEIPGDRQVYPGHGPATTLAEERRFNPYMRRAAER